MTWTDGLTCSVLRDGDAVAEVKKIQQSTYCWSATVPRGSGVGITNRGGGGLGSRDAAKAAAERAIRKMRGEGEE
jgi:hypothetical protein